METQTNTIYKTIGEGEEIEFITFKVSDQLFGLPILAVQDVLGPQKITHVPLANANIRGSLNLRGKIVTAIDICSAMNLEECKTPDKLMNIVVHHGEQLFSLLIDSVGDVMKIPVSNIETNPSTLEPKWREVSVGIVTLKQELMILLNIERILNLATS